MTAYCLLQPVDCQHDLTGRGNLRAGLPLTAAAHVRFFRHHVLAVVLIGRGVDGEHEFIGW
jgi:hypothetical protein